MWSLFHLGDRLNVGLSLLQGEQYHDHHTNQHDENGNYARNGPTLNYFWVLPAYGYHNTLAFSIAH